jgi:hypothetical protein
MLRFKWSLALLWLLAAGLAAGQPALTTIRDILYRADGSRFSGTIFITWDSFLAGDTSSIATSNLTVPIVNGVLNVQLVPTTTASAGAQYNVTYNSLGIDQFAEVWAVPSSMVTLRVRDVRVSSGSIVGPLPVTSPIQISDVTNLVPELAVRPLEGVGYTIGRAAVINSSGQIDGAAGNLGDCVKVDATSGPCGSGGGGGGVLPSFADGEIPAGSITGVNTAFTLAFTPSPAASLDLYLNGLLMKQGTDYTVSGTAITFITASIPQSGDLLVANYRYANPANPLGTLASSQVICSSAGASTSSPALTQLGSCTIPAGLLGTGDRIEVQFQFAHSGTATGFTGTILWGAATVLSRVCIAGESAFVGRVTFGVNSGVQSWDAQSWGSSLSLASSVGSATANIALNVTISLSGQMAASTADSVGLSNFTVIRYPAQVNP